MNQWEGIAGNAGAVDVPNNTRVPEILIIMGGMGKTPAAITSIVCRLLCMAYWGSVDVREILL